MKYVIGVGIASAATLLFSMVKNADDIKEKRHIINLKTNKNFRPFRLVFIADIHRKKLPEEFLGSSADAIIIGGDLTERGVPLHRTADNLRILTRFSPVYFVWGNHDHNVGERKLRKLLEHYKVKVLENESVELFGQPNLKLVGIDYFGERESKLEKAFADVRKEDTVLFAAHTPAIFKFLPATGNPQLRMAGHLHGGQIRLGKIGFYKKGSLKKRGSGYELVTNGYGTSTLPMRLGAEPQYHVLDIFPEKI
ncbi:metallophosphoesterase [Metaplanococcus flavidus]|uniref:Metallophosphoesterase n=1 Tax=Metaplanococcus flavidus TaxID=569883 RepID=A0ABW3LBK0_9BACL